MSRIRLLSRSWSEAATGYQKEIVPRFMPWTLHALESLKACGLPPGLIIVPACGPGWAAYHSITSTAGPGQELPMLARAFPAHEIVGIDLAQGMVDLACQVVNDEGLSKQVSVECGDATSLLPLTKGRPVVGIFSCFGLQQIPKPANALRDWASILAPGGAIVVAYWPPIVEESGPWRCLTDLTVGSEDWQKGIPSIALTSLPGLELISDTHPRFEMVWPSAEEFFEIMSTAGPWRSRLIHYGKQHMDEVGEKFLVMCPGLQDRPLKHYPKARQIVLRMGVLFKHASKL